MKIVLDNKIVLLNLYFSLNLLFCLWGKLSVLFRIDAYSSAICKLKLSGQITNVILPLFLLLLNLLLAAPAIP